MKGNSSFSESGNVVLSVEQWQRAQILNLTKYSKGHLDSAH